MYGLDPALIAAGVAVVWLVGQSAWPKLRGLLPGVKSESPTSLLVAEYEGLERLKARADRRKSAELADAVAKVKDCFMCGDEATDAKSA